jgi:cell wall-associated NlpC family hydrolase
MKRNLYIRIVSFLLCFFVAAGVLIAADSTKVSAAAVSVADSDLQLLTTSVQLEETATEATEITTQKVSGEAVVKYAKKFVGNPYKYGGSSLTKGADCSGFVMAVYKKFGYKLPHSSSAQAKKGKKVSWSNKKPGDIICYYGHVAIYIGNNKIVHASNKKTGIKISNKANYRKVRCVRRIIN